MDCGRHEECNARPPQIASQGPPTNGGRWGCRQTAPPNKPPHNKRNRRPVVAKSGKVPVETVIGCLDARSQRQRNVRIARNPGTKGPPLTTRHLHKRMTRAVERARQGAGGQSGVRHSTRECSGASGSVLTREAAKRLSVDPPGKRSTGHVRPWSRRRCRSTSTAALGTRTGTR